MRERVVDRVVEDRRDGADRVDPETAADRVEAERKRKACLEQPPLAEVEQLVEPVVAVCELALVDEKTRRGRAFARPGRGTGG